MFSTRSLICLAFALALATLGCELTTASESGTPVLVYSKHIKQDQSPVTIGSTLSKEDFSDIIGKLAKENTKVIYVTSDFSNIRNQLNLLKGYDKINYYAAVERPSEVLESDKLALNPKNIAEHSSLSAALDDFNSKMMESDTTTLVLTGKPDLAHSRRKRALADDLNNVTYYAFGENCAAKFHSIYILDQQAGIDGKNTYDLTVDKLNFDCDNNGTSILTVTFKNQTEKTLNLKEAKLRFDSASRSWLYQSGTLQDSTGKSFGLSYMDAPYAMETPLTYSYACTTSRFVLFNDTMKGKPQLKVNFFIEKFQIQAFNTSYNSSSKEYSFGQVNYCQGFFSNGLWMGIIASLILVAILSLGVSLLMQVNTMDRFDDPKGKQLNIAAEK